MKVEALPAGKFVISDESDRIELTQTSYEDVFYAIPIDNGSLYMLLNDTVLDSADARSALKRMADRLGGVETAMTELQAKVKDVSPKPAPPPPPPEEEEEEEKTIVIRPSSRLGPSPVAPSPVTPTPATPAPPKPTPAPAKPVAATPAKAPVQPAHPTPAKPVQPAHPTPVQAAHPTPAKPVQPAPPTPPKPAQPAHPTPAKPAQPAHPTPAKPTYPTPAKAAASSPLAPMAPLLKPGGAKPAPAAEAPKTPAAGVPGLDMKSFAPGGKAVLKLTKVQPDLFAIVYGDLVSTLTRAQYEKIHAMCPAPTSTLFHALMSEVLDGPAKATFRKIVSTAGHSKPVLDALNEQVQNLSPSAPVKKG